MARPRVLPEPLPQVASVPQTKGSESPKSPQSAGPPAVVARTFGHIPGVEVGHVFKTRKEVREAGLHAHAWRGISYAEDGATCIVMSGEYPEDVDSGETIIYTGEGDNQSDQTIEKGGNRALHHSQYNRRPVRVVRGASSTQWAPVEGYRYDGLYEVTNSWSAKGNAGFKVFMFEMKRLPDQPPLKPYTFKNLYNSRMKKPKSGATRGR